MIELKAGKNETGLALKKVLLKYLDQAPASFVYKMLRKKNITLNDKKADGAEILKSGDSIKLYFSEETLEKFHTNREIKNKEASQYEKYQGRIEILYEDDNLIAANKPVGMLSQKATDSDYSMNEYLIDYLLKSNKITKESLDTFRPSVVNRLDRNTSGLILFGKSLFGSRELSKMIRDRKLDKYYLTVVIGSFPKKYYGAAYLTKDEKTNVVSVISENDFHRLKIEDRKKYARIETEYEKLQERNGFSLIRVKLITGKSHQIRAHLKFLGFSVLGDHKYGGTEAKMPGIRNQVLHAYLVNFHSDATLGLAGKKITTGIPGEVAKLFPDFHL